MNEETTKKCLRQVEHIRGHLWHRYSITVNQVIMVATIKPSKWWQKKTYFQQITSIYLFQIMKNCNEQLYE